MGKAFRKSPQVLVAVVLFIIGFVFCFFASLFAGLSASYFLTAQPVEAQIANITAGSDGDSKATVTYMIQGKEYETMLTYYSSSMHIGDVITVYIQPDHPEKAKVKTYLFPAIFGSIGLAMTCSAVGVLLHYRKRQKKIRAVMENGKRVLAQVTQIDQNRHYSVNNRHPFVVFCTYQETPFAPPIIFRSENLWDYPALQPGDWVPVYYDPSKPNIHYVQADLNLESIDL